MMASRQTFHNSGSEEKCYFIVKCRNIESLKKCYETGKWACRDRVAPPHPRCVLTGRLERQPVVLIFSVNNCHGWHGYCEMISFPTSNDKNMDYCTMAPKSTTEIIDDKSDSSVKTRDSFLIAVNKSNSTSKMSDGSEAGSNKSNVDAEMIDRPEGGTVSKSDSEITVSDDTVDNSDPGSDLKSESILTAKNKNEGHLNTNACDIPVEQQADPNWYYFNVEWKTIYLKVFGQQCLPSGRTEGFLLMDNVKVNQARNWQELPEEIGKLMCQMIDDYYSELKQKSQVKHKALASKRPTPYLTSDIHESNQSDWQKIVAKIEVELGQVHLACPFGSQRYNLHRPDSDVDVFTVYQARTKDVLGLNPPKQTIKNNDTEGCDYTILELHRYCDLLASGDPRCVETLFLHESTIVKCSREWGKLKEKSLVFLTRLCLDKYLRDALGSNGVKQLLRWKRENPNRDPSAKIYKLIYVIVRLLQNARDVVQGGPLKVFRELITHEYQILMSVRQGQKTYDDMWLVIKSLMDEVEQQKDSVVTDTLEAEKTAENWLLQQRYLDFNLSSTMTNR